MPEFEPTGEQVAILNHDFRKHARLLAGPGTGKSATLVAWIVKLLSEPNPPKIKLLTFTRAATGELARKVSEHPATVAERPSTIHSFAIAVLLKNPGSGGFPEPLRIADDWEDGVIVKPTLAKRAGVSVKKLDRLIREMASGWESLQPEEDPRITSDERARFLGAWHEHREMLGYTLLAELPYALRNALQHHPDLTGLDFDLLVVDEYQDLNACDLEVLRMIADKGCKLVAAGDDDQSIYSFRRAAPAGIRRFPEDYPGAAEYPLSVTQRCGSKIIDWATYLIEGDPDRPADKPRLSSAPTSPAGEVAMLAFDNETIESVGIAELVQHLMVDEGIDPSEILIMFRGDRNGTFSKPLKEQLEARQIPYSDPDMVKRILADADNRFILEILRLLGNGSDSLAWASILRITTGIGPVFFGYVYDRARNDRTQFGRALLNARTEGFPGLSAASKRIAEGRIDSVLTWLDSHALPPSADLNNGGWGQWIISQTGDGFLPSPSDDLVDLLLKMDGVVEPDIELSRYLNQLNPLGKDLNLAETRGVRIMSMGGSKGLTVKASIIAAAEEGLIPRPDTDTAEERRLLYVAMTRAKQFNYVTWARRRRGPTARSGAPNVGTLRYHSSFLSDGPVRSEAGSSYISRRWPSDSARTG